MNDSRDEYLDDRDSRADAAILGASGYLDLARRVRETNPHAFETPDVPMKGN
jgi:hypothetical protein